MLSRSMPLTRTETGAERLIENVRAASTLPTLFSSATSGTSGPPAGSYAIPNEMVWSAVVVVNPVRPLNGGSDSQLVSPSIVDLKPASVVP
jgi:hypothetical protein